ncbi:GlxA family transcriptional regulator [Aquamicrobium zhengzhouense]|uniref:GlxA family transcriptional regulator n=1 Tax=Aquamicrobium zhengzhouense TaxID=2781738 RepID=A0ABS0SCG9_9HYPH|nr:GlxA family transcriptional regulator [Aquamicrobium zhengzhouense]MBI1621000.1 GlxA family transcriptional regulator [Aquamicrobium zhengzhouense]
MDRLEKTRRLFVFYLVPDFTMLAFTSAVEVLRLANETLGEDVYEWRLASADGGKVRSSCGLSLDVDGSVAAERAALSSMQRPFMALVCAGHHVEEHTDRLLDAWLRECRQRGVAVAGLCTGAHILARAGLLANRRCTIHWENFPGFTEQFRSSQVSLRLFDADGGVHTCAGGTAAFDMMSEIVKADYGDAVVAGICERGLVDRVRCATERQRLPFAKRVGDIHPAVKELIEKMENNLSDPIQIDRLATSSRLSRRQIERLFRAEMGCSPARYYVKLRLERARLLLLQTSIPVVEVAIASGFLSASHFSRCYRETFNCSPQETRNMRMETVPGWLEEAPARKVPASRMPNLLVNAA